MTAEAPLAPALLHGRLIPVTVHFDDLDALGLLHNARYPLLVERAWTELWQEKGVRFDGDWVAAGDACNAGSCAGSPAPACTSTTTTTLEPEPSICGDANADGQVKSADALIALQTAVGTANCPLERCDFNGNGAIATVDALLILRFAVGQPSEPKCPLPSGLPAIPASTTSTTAPA